ncbi:MAG: hypothetical protein JW787_11885 [Sedimentisphaerales bacterium]|nr:hypothetical protein [Sedimentisphaerales bacterium]
MNTDKNNKNLDELITNAISRDGLKFDFNKWKNDHKIEIENFKSQVKSNSVTHEPNIRKIVLLRNISYIAAAFLIISSISVCFALYEKTTNLKDELEIAKSELEAARSTTTIEADETVTINFYLKEHQDFIAHQASLNSAAAQSLQMQVSQDDILYFESIGDQPEYMNPGIIVRNPAFPTQSITSQTPAISNGHTLTLSEARETADFDLSAPSRLFPGYSLDQIRRIEDRDAMQMLYTNGINSISLFEQPLDGQRSLGPQDFREYAVFQNKGQSGGTILAWRDDSLSYVLIGKVEMSQLMDMAQSINAGK